MKTERVYKWDNVKFILILLVIAGHFADNLYGYSWCKTIFLAVYLFHMPAFFFIAGLFSKKTVNADRLDPLKIVPFFLTGILVNFLSYYVRLLTSGSATFYFIWRNQIGWYLFAYAVMYILTWLLRKVRHSYVLVVSLFLMLFAGLDETVGSFLAVSRIITFFPVFYAGYILEEDKARSFLDRAAVKICSVGILAAYCVFVYLKTDLLAQYRGIITGNINYVDVLGERYLSGIPARIIFYIIMILVIAALCSVMPSRKIPFISYGGSNTMPVYFFHLPCVRVLLLIEPFRQLLSHGGKTGIIVVLVSSLIMIFVFTLPPFVKFMDLIMRPRPAVPVSQTSENKKKLWVCH
ncbi:MAG: acyltransferase family protein [Lachnospiraceae bacterium]|nr:acyltransferase family protein [Lachnospiraceae bacterium]